MTYGECMLQISASKSKFSVSSSGAAFVHRRARKTLELPWMLNLVATGFVVTVIAMAAWLNF